LTSLPRVAFLTDTYHEVNGVALTSRQYAEFARRRGYPFLCAYGGDRDVREHRGSVTHVQLERGALSFHLDKGLRHDPLLWRYARELSGAIANFGADVIHITSPGDVGEMGLILAYQLKIPLVISWHTNFQEFGGRRLERMLHWVPGAARDPICRWSERRIMEAMIKFYSFGRVLFAPNDELVSMLEERTGLPTFLMKRGTDTEMFTPARRTVDDGVFRLGYVGRITPEKSVRFLADLEHALRGMGLRNFRFLVVGDGSERDWLKRNLKNAELPGVLLGEKLAEAYANMDLFIFPSKTDTFGNVVQEALASGVPCVVTNKGGPKFIIREGATGFSAASDAEFVERTAELMVSPELLASMSAAARAQACKASWDAVFDEVYAAYDYALDGMAVAAATDTATGREAYRTR
jgi:phosphatidylinositol alpha 1,6-mannosyltransferase